MRILLDHCLLSISIYLCFHFHTNQCSNKFNFCTLKLLFFYPKKKLRKNEKPYLNSMSYSKFTRSTKMIYKSDILIRINYNSNTLYFGKVFYFS